LPCNGYGSLLFDETERSTRSCESGVVMVANPKREEANGHGLEVRVAPE
jgi:hypothetical protein